MSKIEDMTATQGMRIVPVASNRVKIINGTKSVLLDIFELHAGNGFEIMVYNKESQIPKQIIHVDGDGDVTTAPGGA